MTQHYHLTIKDYMRRAFPFGTPRQTEGDALSKLDRQNRFERVLSTSRRQYAGKAANRATGLTIADYLDHPIRAIPSPSDPVTAEIKSDYKKTHTQVEKVPEPVPVSIPEESPVSQSASAPTAPIPVGSGSPSAVTPTMAKDPGSFAYGKDLMPDKRPPDPQPADSKEKHLPVSPVQTADTAVGPAEGVSHLTERQKIDRSVQLAAQRYHLPVDLIDGVIRAESDYQPFAVSSAGAQGLMQLMPGTAEELGVKDPFDIDENVNAGSKYLRKMLDLFHGDVKKALMAYNAGPGTVRRYKGDVPYRETRHYVRRVLDYAGMETEA